jgi:hypothetical protein
MQDSFLFHHYFLARNLDLPLCLPDCIESVAVSSNKIYSLLACIYEWWSEVISTEVLDSERLRRDDGLEALAML